MRRNEAKDEAKALGLKEYFTGKPCKRGHIAPRWVSSRGCTSCGVENSHAWQIANPEKRREHTRVWREANSEKIFAYTKANSGKARERKRAWKKANPEKERENARARYAVNPEKMIAKTNLRKAQQLQAVPIWACKEKIENVYAEARRLTLATGISHHVDHVVPLKSPIVCGLHVHYNLRAIPAVENISKGNRFTVSLPATKGDKLALVQTTGHATQNLADGAIFLS